MRAGTSPVGGGKSEGGMASALEYEFVKIESVVVVGVDVVVFAECAVCSEWECGWCLVLG